MKTRIWIALVLAASLAACGTGRKQLGNDLAVAQDDIWATTGDTDDDQGGTVETFPQLDSLPADLVPDTTLIPPDVELPPECCLTDADCWPGAVCIPGQDGEVFGYCDIAPGPGECYFDSDCDPGQTCEGEGLCHCNADCDWSGPGKCHSPQPGCCSQDWQCANGEICVVPKMVPEDEGLCWPAPDEDECYRDEDCLHDEMCFYAHQAGCTMDSIPYPGFCAPLPEECCLSQSDCPADSLCVWMDYTEDHVGICMPPLEPGACYENAQCAPNELCQGAGICPCMQDCLWAGPGKCEPQNPECCQDDNECLPGHLCVGGEGAVGGTCMFLPTFGECFSNAQCPLGYLCSGANFCNCMENCPSIPGDCYPMGGACCASNDDCDGIDVCAGLDGDGVWTGVCEPPPLKPGDCWLDKDCPAGNTCEGIQVCPCDADCDMLDSFGTCTPYPVGPCCESDFDCGENMVCVEPGPGGKCVPLLDKGSCWWDGNCEDDELCIGASYCPCGDWCGDEDGWEMPGTCMNMADYNCCKTDDDCMAGHVCVGSEFGGATCEPAPALGLCFTDDDCYETQQCTGGTFCPCGMLCAVATMPGNCTPLPGGCCYTDKDCAEDHRCYNAFEFDKMPGSCKPDPNKIEGCPPPGGCCWGDKDCLTGKTCSGAQVCGCIELCWNCGDCMPDQMGLCQ